MMAFAMLTKRLLFDALWERARKNQPAPSLRLIVTLAKLEDVSAAERLLREMQADGAITIVGELGPYPWLTLRRNTYNGDFIRTAIWLDPERREKVTLTPQMVDAPPAFVPIPEIVRSRHSDDPELEKMVADVERRHQREPAAAPKSPSDMMTAIITGPQPTRDAVSQLAEREEYKGASGTARKASGAGESAPAKRIIDRTAPQQEPQLSGAHQTPRAAAPIEMPKRPMSETVEEQRKAIADALNAPVSVDQGTTAGELPAQAAEAGEQAREPQPQAVEARHIPNRRGGVRAPAHIAAFSRGDRQVNIRLPAAVYGALASRAELEGGGAGTIARTIFLEAFTASECDTGRKHKLKAAVVRAWRDDGRTLDAFVTDLIDLGLESYLAFRNQAEAAE